MPDRNRNQPAGLGEQSDNNNSTEGIEDPAMDRSRREELDMEAGERGTDENESSEGRDGQKDIERENAEDTGETRSEE